MALFNGSNSNIGSKKPESSFASIGLILKHHIINSSNSIKEIFLKLINSPYWLKYLVELVPIVVNSQGNIPNFYIIYSKWCSDFLAFSYFLGSNKNSPVSISNNMAANDHISAVSLY